MLGFFKKKKEIKTWTNLYLSWQETLESCSGYDSPEIIEKCKIALLKVKNGEAVYERDSVIFDEIQYSFGLLSGLLKVALRYKGTLNVLDFGGSLGSTYFQNRLFFDNINLRWNVVEQPKFVECGKQYFEDEILKFYYSIDECILSVEKINVVLLSNVIQYIENSDEILDKINDSSIPFIIFDGISFNQKSSRQILKQTVPNNIYEASYPMHIFVESDFLLRLNNYSVLTSFDYFSTPSPYNVDDNTKIIWKGFLLEIK
jgi:putative methyltransferase (TIGR04325 family)